MSKQNQKEPNKEVSTKTEDGERAKVQVVAAAAVSDDPKLTSAAMMLIEEDEARRAAEWRKTATPAQIKMWGRFAYG